MTLRGHIIPYLRVGYLLHLMTAGEILLIGLIVTTFGIDDWLASGDLIGKILLLYPLWSPPVFAQLDARSRYQNYKQVKDQLHAYGFKKIILKPTLKSRCQRDAVVVASDELGYKERCKDYFYSSGYRWYHLLPDFFFTDPLFLLHPRFWKTTFFAPTYRPKYRYDHEPPAPCVADQSLPVADAA